MKTAEKVELGMGEAHRLYWERAREPALLLYGRRRGEALDLRLGSWALGYGGAPSSAPASAFALYRV